METKFAISTQLETMQIRATTEIQVYHVKQDTILNMEMEIF
jgi:hypothetical protein